MAIKKITIKSKARVTNSGNIHVSTSVSNGNKTRRITKTIHVK